MKLAITNDNILPNGAQVVAKNVACGLSDRGHEVHFFYFHRYPGLPSLAEALLTHGVQTEWIAGPRVSCRRYGAWLDACRLCQRSRRLGIDLINAHVWETSYSLAVARHLPRSVRVVLTHHGTTICNSRMTTADRLHLGVNTRYRYEYEDRDHNAKCSAINLGLDTHTLAHARRPKDQARSMLGLPTRAQVVLTIGRANRHRGCDLWKNIVESLEHEHPGDIHFVFIGADRGEYVEHLRRMAQNNPRIIVKGTLPHADVLTWMCAADVLLMTSRTESFAIKAVEALYCGCAIVSHYLGVLSDLVVEGVNGTTVDYMDVEGMVKAVTYWLDGRRPPPFSIPERYTLENMVTAYEGCFARMLSKFGGHSVRD